MRQTYFIRARIIMGLIVLCASHSLLASPSMNSFMLRVWESNPAIKSAQAALDAANANRSAASQPIYNPEMDVELERTDINTLSFGINQSIDWGNKQSAAMNKASANILFAHAELSLQRVALAEEILAALVNLQATHQLQQLAQQRVVLMEEFVLNTDKRQQAGDIGLQDVALAKVALSEAKMQFAKTVAQQAENEARLNAASGFFSTEWPALRQESSVVPTTLNVDEYLGKLPKLIAMKAQFNAAKSNINLSKAATKADPNFGIRGGMEDNTALLRLSFSIPLHIRNNFRAEVEIANQEALQIEFNLLSERHRAKAHIIGAHRRYQLTYSAWQSWKETGLNSLNEQMSLIRTIWKSGEMSTSDFLIQSKQNVDAQETAVDLSTQMWGSLIEWLAASGQIEAWLKDGRDSHLHPATVL